MLRKVFLVSVISCSLLLLISDLVGAQTITIYSGRSKALVEPIVERFEQETGIRAEVRYGSSTQLSMALMEEGSRSPADIFWSQDAGALGAVYNEGILRELPRDLLEKVPPEFRDAAGTWIATSGRARVLAYSKPRVDETELPSEIYELHDPQWEGRVGWAPGNASFQSFVTAMIIADGEQETQQWLQQLDDNGAQRYANNNALIQALSAGEIDLALTNHYYLHRYLENDPDYPVDQTFFTEGDPGNLINVAGVGVLNHSQNQEAAIQFAEFLLTENSQQWFVEETYEYPVARGLDRTPAGTSLDEIRDLNLRINLNELDNREATLQLLREVGLL